MTMVNKKNMRLVVAALRSGKYPQKRGRLKSITSDGTALGYCCMGVMCEVAIEHGVKLAVRTVGINDPDPKVDFDGSTAFLRAKVANWLGVGNGDVMEYDPIVGMDGNETISASYANDGLNWDFEKIAESMESYYKLLEDDDDGE